jgi:hypothetical protein
MDDMVGVTYSLSRYSGRGDLESTDVRKHLVYSLGDAIGLFFAIGRAEGRRHSEVRVGVLLGDGKV